MLGWKEYEMEVVRDKADNCIIVCSIENIDPMGVHTGDSITVAPALTLTDKEYQRMRSASIAVLRAIGVETGGSNVQFAVNPEDGRMVVIEMNPRVSRSSALASKATGFPIASVAARLAVGYTLDELTNDITGATPASFEPAIDYVVTKIPRFAFEKFPGAMPDLNTQMKSVGEVMAIGRTFAESLQKALRGLETGLSGLDEIDIPGADDPAGSHAAVARALGKPTPDRLRVIAQAFRHGLSIEEVNRACSYEPWFLRQIEEIVATEATVRASGLPNDAERLRDLKAMGFSDVRLGKLTGSTELAVRGHRHGLGVRPVYKRIDSCAAEFAAITPYMYSTYERGGLGMPPACESDPTEARKAVILGGGPNRIGQGIEFDYCCCHAAFAMAEIGVESIMINCNPETVSTDYDTSDRLYFEPLTAEDVLEVLHVEGVARRPCRGHRSVRRPDSAEDRPRTGGGRRAHPRHLRRLARPRGGPRTVPGSASSACTSLSRKTASHGRRTEAIHDRRARQLSGGHPPLPRSRRAGDGDRPRRRPARPLYGPPPSWSRPDAPVLIDAYLSRATEVDIDALCDGKDVFVAGVLEHIEEAGVHSGDSACSMPPFSLRPRDDPRTKAPNLRDGHDAERPGADERAVCHRGAALGQAPRIFVLEVNPRASRTVPFVAKTIGRPIAAIAAKIMAGEALASFGLTDEPYNHVAVKEAVFPFAKFPGVDTVLGPEMRSTGEVMGLDWKRDGEPDMGPAFARAFAKSQLAGGVTLPLKGAVFVSVKEADKPWIEEPVRLLVERGFTVLATDGTRRHLAEIGIAAEGVRKVLEGRPHIVDQMKNGEVQLVFNTTEGRQSLEDSFSLRRAALMMKIPYYTTAAGALAAARAVGAMIDGTLEVRALQSMT